MSPRNDCDPPSPLARSVSSTEQDDPSQNLDELRIVAQSWVVLLEMLGLANPVVSRIERFVEDVTLIISMETAGNSFTGMGVASQLAATWGEIKKTTDELIAAHAHSPPENVKAAEGCSWLAKWRRMLTARHFLLAPLAVAVSQGTDDDNGGGGGGGGGAVVCSAKKRSAEGADAKPSKRKKTGITKPRYRTLETLVGESFARLQAMEKLHYDDLLVNVNNEFAPGEDEFTEEESSAGLEKLDDENMISISDDGFVDIDH